MNHLDPPGNWDEADRRQRRIWLEHIATCSACRDPWVAEDGSRLFALLSSQAPEAELPDEERILEDLTAGVMAGIADRRTPVPAGRWTLGRLLAAAVVAATLLMPLAVWWNRQAPENGETVATAPRVQLPLADVEVISTPGESRVIDLSVGDIQVVMIFDAALDI